MKKISILLTIALSGYLFSCQKDKATNLDVSLQKAMDEHSATGTYTGYAMPESSDLAALPNQDKTNRVTKAKVDLGKMLFFETGIGVQPKYDVSMTAYSCSSCHVPERSFTAGRFQGVADGAVGFGQSGEGRLKNPTYDGSEVDAQGARPLPVINLTYVTNALWAGSFGSFGTNVGTESVWDQDTLIAINHKQIEGLEANNQRALVVHRQMMNKEIADSLGYTALFDAAFPDFPASERYSLKTTAFAIAAYFRTILTNRAPFQRWIKGDSYAMTDAQKRGALLFFGKAGCVNCHNSPSLNSMRYFAVGVKNLYQSDFEVFRTGPDDLRNFGRGGFTKREEDMHKFKVPQLYNLKDVGFYFHGASKRSIREVVEYFNQGVPENPEVPVSQIPSAFRPLGLTEAEIIDLTDFIENGLYDPDLLRYKPSATMSGNCFPNNDAQSQADMGCE